MKAREPYLFLMATATTIDNRLIKNPAVFTTERVRFTIVPAISVALGTLKDLKTLKALGATTALKNIAAPSHAAINNILTWLSVLATNLIVVREFRQQ